MIYYLELYDNNMIAEANWYVDDFDPIFESVMGETVFTFVDGERAGDTLVDLITAWKTLREFPEAYMSLTDLGTMDVENCVYILGELVKNSIVHPGGIWKMEAIGE